jgi:alanyl-tRNA synthetase
MVRLGRLNWGFRHVAKTDDIKDFVITEESSIAKGIRRVVAVTGHDANEVSRQGLDFERRLERIEQLQGKDKDAAMKPYLTELGQSGISLVKKNQLKAKFDKIQKEVDALAKAKLNADQKLVSAIVAWSVLRPAICHQDLPRRCDTHAW